MYIPEIIGKYDIKADGNNRWQAANQFTNGNGIKFMPLVDQEMINKLRGLSWHETEKLITPYLEKKYQCNKENMENAVNDMNKYLNDQKEEIFKAMEKLTHHPIEYRMFTIYLTTLNRCPYDWHNGKIRMVDSRTPEGRSKRWKRILTHELLHMQTHRYYENIEPMSKLSKREFNDLKESLTFLLNHEFKGIDMDKDNGYPQHQKLRNVLEEYRIESDKNFTNLISFGCQYIQNNNYFKKTIPYKIK